MISASLSSISIFSLGRLSAFFLALVYHLALALLFFSPPSSFVPAHSMRYVYSLK